MSKKRGLSLEEKREKILQIFYDSQDFFLLKELEKLGPKKGVISQSVKDVVQSLVDDDLVSKDKIGTSVYFWSLPSCAGNQLRNVYRKLDSDLQSSKKRYAELVDQCGALKKGREESDEREEALAVLKTIEMKHNELKEEMGKYADNDPAAFEAMISSSFRHIDSFNSKIAEKAIEVAHVAANRWTDNIFTLRQWCSNNFPQAKEQLENMYQEVQSVLGVTLSFDSHAIIVSNGICLSNFLVSVVHKESTLIVSIEPVYQAGITDDFDYLELLPVIPLDSVTDQMPEGNP
ncbi:unnamed protein product [Dovyalis caffra]|uniref:Meiotic nuclear division protein 1 homolog n=1 Tax=Dovyalis caffra TaxID=77055 RepID=A0AAV1QWF3_9ROSI|nr:unnamed protein product [Dovyalis caffra]